MTSSLVGSEMCIRDRGKHVLSWAQQGRRAVSIERGCFRPRSTSSDRLSGCLLYTSDAADDM
eukprot:10750302-Prorocentrum_lima.AAC.1